MTERLLFVDDDRSLLSALERNLIFDYELDLADSGTRALQLIEGAENPYSVIVVDMQMPGMNGVQTIRQARKRSPHSVYMMLTGNQDSATASQAMKEGRVFRFLNKPCEMTAIRDSVEHAKKFYTQSQCDRKIINDIFVNEIGFDPTLWDAPVANGLDTTLLINTLNQLHATTGLESTWHERLAVRVALVALTMLNTPSKRSLLSHEISAPEHAQGMKALCGLAASIVNEISQLGDVAQLLKLVPSMDGRLTDSSAREHVSATLIKLAIYWNLLTIRGVSRAVAVRNIKTAMPQCDKQLVRAIEKLSDYREFLTPLELRVDELCAGMVLFEDLCDPLKNRILPQGIALSEPMIALARNVKQNSLVSVVESSCFERLWGQGSL